MEFAEVQKFAGALHLVCQIPVVIHIARSEYVNSLIHWTDSSTESYLMNI